jgi:hypothetical protein
MVPYRASHAAFASSHDDEEIRTIDLRIPVRGELNIVGWFYRTTSIPSIDPAALP